MEAWCRIAGDGLAASPNKHSRHLCTNSNDRIPYHQLHHEVIQRIELGSKIKSHSKKHKYGCDHSVLGYAQTIDNL